ncbi:aldose epimerase family protein [Tenacibaculum agarivorans]|uniref:aldose epimerase family protein n=1 Tax=Tenacibaculum agarivorans TaxID=1908389 RepID=UPI00094B80A8|nr:aldose epimerase family protein [Tenacibaculum agarivorans]
MNSKKLNSTIPSSVRLTNKHGMELLVSSFGATIISLKVPNKHHQFTNVVLSLKDEKEYFNQAYLNERIYLGSTVGRYAGRISNKSFTIDQNTYELPHDENGVHLHGGINGFDRKNWNIIEIIEDDGHISKVTFSYTSKHLEEGFPGNLVLNATYIVTDENQVKINYSATSDKKTHVNITNHSYYNLNGGNSILDHQLQLHCDKRLEVNKHLIPTGNILKVQNTKYDYRDLKFINDGAFNGLDDTFIFNQNNNNIILYSEETGITMMVTTNQPAVVIYTPFNFNHLNLSKKTEYSNYPAICFETQKYPDTPNNPHFPSTLLKPNETYLNETTLTFTID